LGWLGFFKELNQLQTKPLDCFGFPK